MGISTEIDRESGLRIHVVTGRLTMEDLIGSLEKVYSRPDYDPAMNVLWDLRDADFSAFVSPQIQQVRDFVTSNWGTEGTSHAAMVVSSDEAFGLMRMYEFYLKQKSRNEVQVFRDYDEALDWITKK
ncbi:MAG: STAS/SEC14 domain-containing protein [Bacteroidales bacterium]|nr:STAS/SEC14 domain-containing protein [Candidatus Latescibacterota bacterium]